MKLHEITTQIFLDVDGVLADFDGGVKKILGKYPGELPQDEFWDMIEPYFQKGFFNTLEKIPDSDKLWKYVKKYNPIFLTASGGGVNHSKISKDKNSWLKRNYGSNYRIIITQRSRDKSMYATPNSILIDDRVKSIMPWVSAGGIGILHKDAESTIQKLKELGF